MGAMRPASRMRPVELDDEDAAGPDAGPPRDGSGGDGDGRAGDRPRWWPWLLVALVLVVGAGLVATGASERGARERADAFGRLPGVVRPLEDAPEELWRVAADGPTPVVGAGGGVVTVSGADGPWTVRSADAATGDVRWSVTVTEPSGAGFETVAVACVGDPDPAAPLLCLWRDPNVVYGSAGESTPYVPPTNVLALDAGDGSRVGSWQVEGSVLAAVRHDDDVVVATGLADRHVLVERRSGADGAVLWSWTSPTELVEAGGLRAAPTLVGDGDVIALVAVSTALLDVRTGRVVEAGPPGRQILVGDLPDGGFVTWTSGRGARLRDADGSTRGEIAGLPSVVVGDRSVDVLLVDAGNRVLGVRTADGSAVWELSTSLSPVAVADGVVVMAGAASVGAVDGTEGRLLWERELTGELRAGPLTDGFHVLVPEPDGARRTTLVARGLRDGVESWRVALPTGVQAVTAVAGHVVARTGTEVVVIG